MCEIIIDQTQEKVKVGKIVCIGRNYAAHAKELGNEIPEFPVVFLKPASVLIQSGQKIEYPDYSKDLQHEVELVLLIGKKIKNALLKESSNSVKGIGVGLDMTLRDLQSEFAKKGDPWTLSKVFDGSAVVSKFKPANYLDLNKNISLKVNNKLKQCAKLSEMIFKPADIVKYISHKMTLEAGDLIFTGTPAGVSAVNRGDIIEGEVEEIGTVLTEII